MNHRLSSGARSWSPTVVLFMVLGLAVASLASSDQKIEINHSNGEIKLDSELMKPGTPIRIKAREKLTVQVTNTNTALYTYSMKAEKIDVEETKALQAFFKGLGRYLVDLPATAFPIKTAPPPSAPSDPQLEALNLVPAQFKTSSARLDELATKYADDLAFAARLANKLAGATPPHTAIKTLGDTIIKEHLGTNGVQATYLETIHALRNMSPATNVDDTATTLARNLCNSNRLEGLSSSSPIDVCWKARLAAVGILHTKLTDLSQKYPQFQANLPGWFDPVTQKKRFTAIKHEYDLVPYEHYRQADRTRYEHIQTVLAAAQVSEQAEAILDDADKIMAAAYATEALAQRAMQAKSVWTAPATYSVTWKKGKKLTLTVAPRSESELKRLATLKPINLELTVLPELGFKPAVGLALVASPDSTFPKFEKDDTTGLFKESGTTDSRFTYGLTLGLTYRGLDDRKGKGFALWAPELTLNPSDDVKALGIGIAGSWRALKIGTGLLWTKHTVANDAMDATRESYGSAEWYISISVIGWQPFVNE